MSITRTAWTDDDGSGTTGTIINNAEKTTLYDQIDGRWSRATTTSTGTQTVISFSEADLLLCNNASLLTIRSLTAPASPAKPGKRLIVASIGAGDVVLNHQDTTGTTAANRMINCATSAGTPLAAGSGMAVYTYDDNASRWRLVHHEQGAWITPTFAAGDYTAATGTWTVDGADVVTAKYRLVGRTLHFNLHIQNSDISNTAAPVRRVVPGGFTIAHTVSFVNRSIDAGGASAAGLAVATAAATTLDFYPTVAAGNWTATTGDNSFVIGSMTFEVT